MATPRRINSWNTQCDLPTPSFEKDFIANTQCKAWACKAVHKGFEIRQLSSQSCASNVSKTFRGKGERFTGPQIWQMLGSKESADKMTILERDAWQSFRNVVHGFPGRNKANNNEDCVETLL